MWTSSHGYHSVGQTHLFICTIKKKSQWGLSPMYLQCPHDQLNAIRKFQTRTRKNIFLLLTLPLLTSFKKMAFPEIITVCSFPELSQRGFDRGITKSLFNEKSTSNHNSHTPSTTIGHNLILISLATYMNVLCLFRYW